MTKYYLKFFVISLVSILSFTSVANAGHVEIVNNDVPSEIDGVKMRTVLSFMGAKSGYINMKVPGHGQNSGTKSLPNDTYGDVMFSFAPVDPYGKAPHLSVACNVNDHGTKQPLVVDEKTDFSIDVGYEPTSKTVTCKISGIDKK